MDFEAELRAVPERRYHHLHPFNRRMHAGTLSKEELRGWILNRFHYQRHIPIKDALILAKLDRPERRRMWIHRITDHDGGVEGEGGIERWLRLGEAAGLTRDELWSGEGVVPGVRLAVDGYVNLCRHGTALEAVAASLTELFAPDLMRVRIAAFERHYPWIDPEGLRYFRVRVEQGARDGGQALPLVLSWARTPDQRRAALDALAYKCQVLWTMLDAIEEACR
ncbi:pyrroloquinoline-quinone synthase PqqC [Thermomonospora umbrina]|uniref:Pyrroloquinoline-quinone synthase n=1 Tax=Thermomonospora umbrina TaxID=111806 RepID=A0A3D9SPQ8_9ACTN|nr:pyrroloquinoline-quinone synthase PqqC [Thermomonospora umbrina]REE97597.1 pyrroloquinoline-quinone synthase [Thermomonospora umbrina]